MTKAAEIPAGYNPNGSKIGDDTSHLVRVDGERSKGWQLRLPKWHPMGPATRLFSDQSYFGPVGAYAAAKAARDVYFDGLPLTPNAYVSNSRTSSGISGVNLNFASRLKGASAFSWVACWMENGKQHKLRFSVAMYDFVNALDLAIAMRENKAGVVVTPEQRAQAMSLKAEVDAWINHGTMPQLKPVKTVTPVALRDTKVPHTSIETIQTSAPVASASEVREAKAGQTKKSAPRAAAAPAATPQAEATASM